jgi:C-terminal processing protease CtpA/Prc
MMDAHVARGARDACAQWSVARSLLVATVLLALACTPEETNPNPNPQREVTQEAWCERVAGGPAGTAPGPIAMSQAHALVRFFSAGASYREADEALATALEGATVDWDGAALKYAEALQPVCALDASSQPLPAARVEQVGRVAVIYPGTGDIVLPTSTQAVAIDLRGLPADPELEPALARAIAVASARPVNRTPANVRLHQGMTDERATNVYSNDVSSTRPPPFAATGNKDLPVALLTGPTLAPAAARFAVDLRLEQRAWIFGEPVITAVAEYRWAPIGRRGLAIRTEVLSDARGMVPDVIVADRPLQSDLNASLGSLAELSSPPAVDRAAVGTRVLMARRRIVAEATSPLEPTPGVARANLVIVHGALRRFFPYFPIVGDQLDERLQASLAEVDAAPLDWTRIGQVLERFGESIHDGHVNVELSRLPSAGYFLALLEEVGGEVVVRRSGVVDVRPGDTLVSVGGRPMADWLAEERPRTSASTEGHRFARLLQKLTRLSKPTVFGIRAPDSSTRSVEVMPGSLSERSEFGNGPTNRQPGRLGDLGAPDIAYINMASNVLGDLGAFQRAVSEAAGARGLIVDMRGYPGISQYEALPHLIPQAFSSPLFRVPTWSGPDTLEVRESASSLVPAASPSYGGPIVLLVGPVTVSAAENFSMMLVGAHRVRVVGRRSAGTNGNVSRLWMPGGISFMFTGMEVLFPDRSRFHGIGIVPELEVQPTAADLAAGRDPELLKAIELLSAGG